MLFRGPIIDQAALHAWRLPQNPRSGVKSQEFWPFTRIIIAQHLGLPWLEVKCSSFTPDDGLVNSEGESRSKQE
jgi:hypothetical protein